MSNRHSNMAERQELSTRAAGQRVLRMPRWTVMTITICLGCLQPPRGYERYTPPADQARRALETALAAWQSDTPIALVDSGPQVHFEDTTRRPGQRLTSYEILGEVAGDAGRWYDVRLELETREEDNEPARHDELQVRYTVFGIDPLWVVRQENQELINHWDHAMEAEKPLGAASQ